MYVGVSTKEYWSLELIKRSFVLQNKMSSHWFSFTACIIKHFSIQNIASSPVLVHWWPAVLWLPAGLTRDSQTPGSQRWIPWLLLLLLGWPADSAAGAEKLFINHITKKQNKKRNLTHSCSMLLWGRNRITAAGSVQTEVLFIIQLSQVCAPKPNGKRRWRVGRNAVNRRAIMKKWPFYHCKCFFCPPGSLTGKVKSALPAATAQLYSA